MAKAKGIWLPAELLRSEKARELTCSERVLLAQVHMLDNEDGCWASNRWLADQLGVTEGSVGRLVKRLAAAGWITVEGEVFVRTTGGKMVRRRIIRSLMTEVLASESPPQNEGANVESPPDSAGVNGQSPPQNGGTSPPQNGSQRKTSPTDSPDHCKDPSGGLPYGTDFQKWWEVYPRKTGRAAAHRKYVACRRAGAGKESLLRAAHNYAAANRTTEARFIKHGATFLGPDRWWAEWVDGPPREVEDHTREYKFAN